MYYSLFSSTSFVFIVTASTPKLNEFKSSQVFNVINIIRRYNTVAIYSSTHFL